MEMHFYDGNREPLYPLAGLDHLTRPSDLVGAGDGIVECGEGMVDVGAALAAHCEAAELVKPGEGSPDHSAATAEALRGIFAPTSSTWGDQAGAASGTATAMIARLVGVQLCGSLVRSSAPAPHAGRGIEGCDQQHGGVPVGAR